MKRSIRTTLIAAALIGATSLTVTAFAHGGMGAGMMGGYGMGPGMMGGYGPGYGMGPGMMHGYDMGPGMMWGYGSGTASALKLDDEQRSKIAKIQNDTGRKQQELVAKMREEQRRMAQLSSADNLDEAAMSNSYKALSALRQQMFDNSLAARKQIEGVLTKEQRQQLRAGDHCGWAYGNT